MLRFHSLPAKRSLLVALCLCVQAAFCALSVSAHAADDVAAKPQTPHVAANTSDDDADRVSAPDTIAQRVKACAACHGEQGRAAPDGYYPRIAGKPAGYLYNQLVNFRDGHRTYPIMAYLVSYMSDEYLREIADYFSHQNPPFPPPAKTEASPETLQRGEQLVRKGDAAQGIPACSSCHGAAMTGVLPSIPGLVGLPRHYLVAQIGGWKNGLRHAAEPDCMSQVAKKLTAEDIGAVSAWLASQPVPQGALPVPPSQGQLPLECGSVPH